MTYFDINAKFIIIIMQKNNQTLFDKGDVIWEDKLIKKKLLWMLLKN